MTASTSKNTSSKISLPPQALSTELLLEKYAKGDETTVEAVRDRVVQALVSVEKEEVRSDVEAAFKSIILSDFIPAGRINSAAGTDLTATLLNCFVQPVGDSITEDKSGMPSIYTALAQAAETMRRGGGVGYNFSHIRPKDAFVKGTGTRASGPLSYMKVFDTSCQTVESAGSRRGAQMGILNCEHPDIEQFVVAKQTAGMFNNFNLSIGVSDKFMKAVANDLDWDLVHSAEPHEVYKKVYGSFYDPHTNLWVWKTIRARDLWDVIMRSTYDMAEPGIVFLDRMNEENNLYYAEIIEATNPCAEEPLPAYGCCCLGSINLTRMIDNPFTKDASFNKDRFVAAVRIAIRALDNVLDVSPWPLPEQYEEAMNKRRIGLGFLGLGDAMVMQGLRYDSAEGVEFARMVSELMRDEAYTASVDLAIEKGPFKLFDAKKYLAGNFVKRLPKKIRDRISKYGIRNSHLLSIAPTGTITQAFADNASNGIEPAFSWFYDRKKREADGSTTTHRMYDHAYRVYRDMFGDEHALPDYFVSATEMSVAAHVDVMKAVQPYIDTSISKTVNIPADYPYDDFKDLYMYAWKSGLKGLATYRPNSTLGSVLSLVEEPKVENEIAEDPTPTNEEIYKDIAIALHNTSFECREDGILEGITLKDKFESYQGTQNFLITVNFKTISQIVGDVHVVVKKPMEFILTSDFTGTSSSWAVCFRMLSLLARSGSSIPKALENMKEIVWEHGNVRYGYYTKEDGRIVPRWHRSDSAALGYAIEKMLISAGYLDTDGKPTYAFTTVRTDLPVMAEEEVVVKVETNDVKPTVAIAGKLCKSCGANAVIKSDGCERCTNCGEIGSCG